MITKQNNMFNHEKGAKRVHSLPTLLGKVYAEATPYKLLRATRNVTRAHTAALWVKEKSSAQKWHFGQWEILLYVDIAK